jgi:hypothetical protein
MIEDDIRYVPAGKYITAGVVVLDVQPLPQRPPASIALLIAAVSSVTPFPKPIESNQYNMLQMQGS